MTAPDENRTKNSLEWTVFGLSTVLVLAVIVLLAIAATRTRPGPPRLRVTTGKPAAAAGWITIPVTVRNEGGQVAENVHVRVVIGAGDSRLEAGFTIAYVPRDAERKGSVSFRSDDPNPQPTCEILGYREP